MKLSCIKCGNGLTKDLYPTKKWKTTVFRDTAETMDGETVEYSHWEFEVRPGSFLLSRQQWGPVAKRLYPESILVSKHDIIDQEQLKYRKGRGCCGNAWTDFVCSCCGEKLGEQNLDCYQEKRVELHTRKVVRKYDRSN